MWSKGWDAEMGGIIYFRDALGRSATEYWHDMKFWWPQCEATIANLMAYSMTGKESYLTQFDTVHQYIKGHFIDREFGEWYGYLHRDGSLSTPLKGNMYKGPFHIPRMYLVCCQLLDELRR
jgi:N-acylglucosamine 2-epimerase